ncbi:MAG TPA: hypothetical protein VJ208_03275 [Candidatus Nanoarchaeia archaeon]|nr:hypothetical protein [Candidatus Nanoarchaeia archaeon]
MAVKDIGEYSVGIIVDFGVHWNDTRFGIIISKEEYNNSLYAFGIKPLFESLADPFYVRVFDGTCKEIKFELYNAPKIVSLEEVLRILDSDIRKLEKIKEFLRNN